jgi:hypothetical protein
MYLNSNLKVGCNNVRGFPIQDLDNLCNSSKTSCIFRVSINTNAYVASCANVAQPRCTEECIIDLLLTLKRSLEGLCNLLSVCHASTAALAKLYVQRK